MQYQIQDKHGNEIPFWELDQFIADYWDVEVKKTEYASPKGYEYHKLLSWHNILIVPIQNSKFIPYENYKNPWDNVKTYLLKPSMEEISLCNNKEERDAKYNETFDLYMPYLNLIDHLQLHKYKIVHK